MKLEKTSTKKTLDDFLKERLNASDYEDLHLKMKVSKKMLTCIKQEPTKMTIPQLVDMANITNSSVENLISIII